MSFTEVLEQTPTRTSKFQNLQSKMLITPKKCRRVDEAGNEDAAPVLLSTEDMKPKAHLPTLMQCFQWTLTKDAIATCFIRDVLELRQDLQHEFFWLGRVPCRSVRIMGIVVGVQQKEKETWYTVDDGTAVIDCAVKHPKPSKSEVPKIKPTSSAGVKPKSPEVYIPPPPPVAKVGQLVKVHGKVARGFDCFNLRVEEQKIAVCSWNEEALHWKAVVELHKSNYDLSEPFRIPVIARAPPIAPSDPGPSSQTQIVSSQPSQSSTVSPNTPKSDISTKPKAPRLRHPSRLHSQDLTENTFRIYVKHYMDNAPPYVPGHLTHDCDEQKTPTRARQNSSPENTPTWHTVDTEDKGKRRLDDLDDDDDDVPQYGFTLSYLRRVPILAELAGRIVRAERRRREREARKMAEFDNGQSRPSRSQGKYASTESEVKKTKRLFVKTIRDLYTEGNIVLWDGPVRPWWSAMDIDARKAGNSSSLDANEMWQTMSMSGSINVSTLSTATSSTNTTMRDGDAGELSDPSPSEEYYVSVTAAFLAPIVERAIGVLVTRAQRHRPQSQSQPDVRTRSISTRTDASKSTATQQASRGPTAESILKHLHASDERWANLGVWSVEDALKELTGKGQVVKREGRWGLRVL